jgi:hypothetical protein
VTDVVAFPLTTVDMEALLRQDALVMEGIPDHFQLYEEPEFCQQKFLTITARTATIGSNPLEEIYDGFLVLVGRISAIPAKWVRRLHAVESDPHIYFVKDLIAFRFDQEAPLGIRRSLEPCRVSPW